MNRCIPMMCIIFFVYSSAQGSYLIYSPGFGGEHKNEAAADFYRKKFFIDGNNFSLVRYPDANGHFNRAVFYTQPSVHTLANQLYDKIILHPHNSLILAGFSCGAGTIINCLAELCNADGKEYFNNTRLTNKYHMMALIEALNNGALVLSSPLLHMKKVKMIQHVAILAQSATLGTGLAAAYYLTFSHLKKTQLPLRLVALSAAGLLAYYKIGKQIKNRYTDAILYHALPAITHYHYDPHHTSPLENVEQLRGKLRCPILLHFHLHDGILDDPDEDVIQFYDAIKNERTHIIITTDAWHKQHSLQWKEAIEIFQSHYFPTNDKTAPLTDAQWNSWCKKTQPTRAQLRRQIMHMSKQPIAQLTCL